MLCDEGDGVAERAAQARATLWDTATCMCSRAASRAGKRPGYTIYAGVNVPSKAFGELVELERHTPRVTADELQAMRESREDMVIVDGRTFAEFQKMNIPDGICCPNGELALRIRELVPDPKTKIVVNCAGRTRSIIGAQTLIDFGVPNPVVALENGTQGWFLAGLKLENGAQRRYGETGQAGHGCAERTGLRARPRARGGVRIRRAGQPVARGRDTHPLSARCPDTGRVCGKPAPAFAHAPGGQLVQTTDHWIGTRGARIVLLDDELVRAPMTAQWLRQLGHEAYVLEGGVAAAKKIEAPRAPGGEIPPGARPDRGRRAREKAGRPKRAGLDLRPSMSYRKEHIDGAVWSIRPRVATDAKAASAIVLVADRPEIAALAALDLAEAGIARRPRVVGRARGGARRGVADGIHARRLRRMRTASTTCSSRPGATRATKPPRGST